MVVMLVEALVKWVSDKAAHERVDRVDRPVENLSARPPYPLRLNLTLFALEVAWTLTRSDCVDTPMLLCMLHHLKLNTYI